MRTNAKPADMPLGQLIEEYRDSSAFTSMSPNSQRTYDIYLNRLVALRTRMVSTLARADIYKIWDAATTTPGAQAAIIKVSRRLFSWGLERGLIESAPVIKPSRNDLGGKSHPHEQWTDADISRFREAAREYSEMHGAHRYVGDALEIALATGQRLSDIVNSMLTKNFDGEYFKVTQGKTGEVIQFKPSGRFREILERAIRANDKFVLVMRGHAHGRLARLRYHFDAVREMAQVNATFHGLRKTVACRLRENGATNAQIAALLGHKTTRMVELYAAQADRVTLATAASDLMSSLQTQEK